MKNLLPIACLFFGTAIAGAPSSLAFDFKGVVIGSPGIPSEIQERLGVSCGVGGRDNELQVCNGQVTVAKERAKLNLVIGSDGNVQRIRLSMDADEFDNIRPELRKKFGAPTRTESPTLQNRYGAEFHQTIDIWTGANGTRIEFTRYAGDLDKSSLYFSTEADRRLLSGASEDRSGDL